MMLKGCERGRARERESESVYENNKNKKRVLVTKVCDKERNEKKRKGR